MGDMEQFFNDVKARFDAAIAPGQAAWGDDKFGSTFAADFTGGCTNMRAGTENMAHTCGQISTGQGDSSRALTEKEQLSRDGFRNLQA